MIKLTTMINKRCEITLDKKDTEELLTSLDKDSGLYKRMKWIIDKANNEKTVSKPKGQREHFMQDSTTPQRYKNLQPAKQGYP